MTDKPGKPRDIRWTWQSSDSDIRVGYMVVDGRISLAELNALMRDVAPYADPEEIMLNWATAVWTRPATPEETAQRREAHKRWEARHEAWERETLAKLIQKYGKRGGRDAP